MTTAADDGDVAPCGCCAGIGRQTPRAIANRPGLSAIACRAGTHASFKASMLSALSDPDNAALAGLTTRDDGDFSIALLDAWAVAADILTFYQERLGNESYLGTAVERRSALELARLVGYRPSPGVAAAAPLAFLLSDAPGSPDPVPIPAGTRVQSIPGPGQTAQTFETAADLVARIEHNALGPRMTTAVDWTTIGSTLWLEGTATGLKVGDTVLFVDASRVGQPDSEMWQVRTLVAVDADAPGRRTRIAWDTPLWADFQRAATAVTLYALRKQASLFGVNAIDPRALPALTRRTYPGANDDDWPFTLDGTAVALDTTYPGLTAGGWAVLGLRTERKLYAITAVADVAPLKYMLSSKATELTLELGPGREPLRLLAWIVSLTRQATVFVQSEALPIAAQPIIDWAPPIAVGWASGMPRPVEGKALDLAGGALLTAPQHVGLTGKRLRVTVTNGSATLVLPSTPTPAACLPGDVFLLDAFPPSPSDADASTLSWSVLTPKGTAGTLRAQLGAVTLGPSDPTDPLATEAAVAVTVDKTASGAVLTFRTALARVYDRTTVTVNANVVQATQGETVQDLLGSGDASVAGQTFALRQSPLTYVSTPSGQGAQSTLQVWVNDLRWQERTTLMGSGPRDRVFATRHKDDGTVTVRFGDGREGLRPPTGTMNVRAIYRKGIGTAGNVAGGQLSQAIDRPQGLKAVSNPAPASGGADPDGPDDARRSAPLHMLTLGRVVSLADYETYATAFAGIAKALATWTRIGTMRGIVITVAAPGGAALDPAGDTIANLTAALATVGNPSLSVQVLSFRPRLFRIGATLRIDGTISDPDTVSTAARTAAAAAFGFAAGTLGGSIALSRVVAVLQAVPGVLGVQVSDFSTEDQGETGTPPAWLTAFAPPPGLSDDVLPAELLMLDPAALAAIKAMP